MGHGAATSEVIQPASFAFTDENLKLAQGFIAKYPAGRQQSAVMPLLTLAQRQNDNWLPRAAMDVVAEMLDMAPVRVYEVASFYTMYNLAPVGKHFVQVCTTTPCWLRGSDEVVKACEDHLGIRIGETTPDGMFTLREVECLGACVNAPIVQVGDYFYEDVEARNVTDILRLLKRGEPPPHGSLAGRQGAAPITGPTTLKTLEFAAPSDKAPVARKPKKTDGDA